ncbi:S8 family serine peptidase [Winogradskyella sp. PE311]|uniref:S8 family serine peptidase n=1 Tax=Winogradskyella sp. PE311 TaxID=3366943 RepID=UPI0039805550
MKNLLNLCVLALSVTFSFAQTTMSKEQFSQLNKNQQDVYLRIKVTDSLRTLRVNNYLAQNENRTKTFLNETGKTFVMYDIVEGKPIYRTTDNTNAAIATGTNHLQVGGSLGLDLDGSGLTVGVWDGGPVQDTHTEFMDPAGSTSRVAIIENTRTDGSMGFSSHGTHVAGTISARGVLPAAKGMATNVSVKSYNFNNDTPEMVLAVADLANPIILSNHSYGIPAENVEPWWKGAYSSGAFEVDDIAKANPQYLIVASAGNSGNYVYEGGLFANSDKLTGDKTAKNTLVIANANPSIDAFTNQVTLDINSSSSQGPTDDLRIKPDLAGDGTALRSTEVVDTYSLKSGTSMAAPNVTGSLALLQQYYNQLNGVYMLSSTLKGLVCHTATDDPLRIGPDHVFGWGMLNAKAAAEVITGSQTRSSIIEELTLNNNQSYSFNFTAQAGDKLKATICWTDVPGGILSGEDNLNNPSPRLINDLDLRLTKDGTTYFPWKLDYDSSFGFSNSKADNNVDNIEVIEIDAPASGTYTLTVNHKGTLSGAGPFDPLEQDYSLIVSGNSLVLGVDDNDFSNSLDIYPNPTKGEFTISFQSNLNDANNQVDIDIYDIRGRLVYNNDFINSSVIFKQAITLNNLKSGVYIINIKEGNRQTSRKLIIE